MSRGEKETYACYPVAGPLRANWAVEHLILPFIRGTRNNGFTFKKFMGTLYVVGEPKDLKDGLPVLEREPWRTGRPAPTEPPCQP